jgi:hypothetical protein
MTNERLYDIRANLREYQAPVATHEDYDPRCTCGSLIPECDPCATVRMRHAEKRDIYLRRAPLDVADLIAEVERLRQ